MTVTSQIQGIIKQGDELAKQGKFDSAIAKYQRALRIEPANIEVREKIIEMYKNKGAYREAIIEYVKLAKTSKSKGNLDFAVKVLEDCLNIEQTIKKKGKIFGRSATVDLGIIREALQEYKPSIYYELGEIYIEAGNLSLAEESFRKSLEEGGDKLVDIHRNLGEIYLKQGDTERALGEFQEIMRITPEDASVYESIGNIYLNQDKLPKAVQGFLQAGDIYFRQEKFKEAIRVYEAILKIESENNEVIAKLIEAYSQLGVLEKASEYSLYLATIYDKEGLLDKVIPLYEQVLKWQPDREEVAEKLIAIYRRIKTLDPENLSYREKLIATLNTLNKQDEVINEYLELAQYYLKKGEFDRGIEVCRELLSTSLVLPEVHIVLSEFYSNKGQLEEAQKELMQAMTIYKEIGKQEEADKAYKKLTSLSPDATSTHYELALNMLKRGDKEEAIKELRIVLDEDPHHIPSLLKLSELYIEKGMLDEGINLIKQVLTLSPKDPAPREKLVEAYMNLGLFKEAFEEIRGLGDLYLELENFSQAEKFYKAVLEYAPNNLPAKEGLIEVYKRQGKTLKAKIGMMVIANTFHRKKELLKAIELSQRLLELDPKDMNIRRKLANYYLTQELPSKAVKELMFLAEVYMSHQLVQQAIEIYKKIVEIHPEKFEVYIKLSELLVSDGRIEEAIAVYFKLVDIYISLKMLTEAKDIYQRIIKLQPENIEARQKLGELYLDMGQLSEAIVCFEDVISVYLKQQRIDLALENYWRIVELNKKKGNFRGAVEVLRKLIALYREQDREQESINARTDLIALLEKMESWREAIEARQELADLLLRLGDLDIATVEYEVVAQGYIKLGRVEDAFSAHRKLIDIFIKGKEWNKAIEQCNKIIEVYERGGFYQEIIEIYRILADIYTAQKELLKYIEVYDKIVLVQLKMEDKEGALETYQNLAEELIAKGENTYAAEIYEKALAIEPYNFMLRFILIDLYIRLGKHDEAVKNYCKNMLYYAKENNKEKLIETFNQAIEFSPQNVELYCSFAEAHVELGEWEEALRIYEEIIERNPEKHFIYPRLIGLYAKQGKIKEAVELAGKLVKQGEAEAICDYFEELFKKDDIKLLYNWGLIFKDLFFFHEALDIFHFCAEKDERILLNTGIIGVCLRDWGLKDLAVKYFKNVLQEKEGEELSEILYQLAFTLEDMGDYPSAKATYEKICEVDIKYKDVMDRIVKLDKLIKEMGDDLKIVDITEAKKT